MANILVLGVILLPWLGATVVWLAGDRRPRMLNLVAIGFSLLTGICALGLLLLPGECIVLSIPVGSFFGAPTFRVDGLGVFHALVASGIGCLTIIFSVDYMRGERQLNRYYFFVLLFIGAMCGLVLSNSLLFLFFFWEITALSSYALISFYNDDPKAVIGGIKALVITQLGGVGLLVGALVVYAYLGTFEIDVFIREAGMIPVRILPVMAYGFLIAAAAKSAQLPFFTWLPDAMEAPTPVSALIHAATMVNAGVYLLARFFPVFSAVPGWKLAVLIVGMMTALCAALMAVVATDLKRVLAYSTVSQLGYMVYAIGSGSILASQFHLLSHAIFKALLFLAAGAVIHTTGTREMVQMGDLGKKMPFVRNVFIIGALALAGIPVLNGFWSKELILEAGFHGGARWSFWVMAVGAGITGLYTTRMLWMVFFKPAIAPRQVYDASMIMRIPLGILAVATLSSWLLIGPFSKKLQESFSLGMLPRISFTHLVTEVLSNPTTWIVLGLVVCGAVMCLQKDRISAVVRGMQWLERAARSSFGFEWINQKIVLGLNQVANCLRFTQTGILNWNVFGISTGILAVLLILMLWN